MTKAAKREDSIEDNATPEIAADDPLFELSQIMGLDDEAAAEPSVNIDPQIDLEDALLAEMVVEPEIDAPSMATDDPAPTAESLEDELTTMLGGEVSVAAEVPAPDVEAEAAQAAISGSELRAVSTFSRALGFDAWVGEVSYVERDGILTGELNTLQQTKEKILESLITKFNLETRGSTAVGDTSTDVGVLRMVETPIVFNPNQSLFKVARENGWMVVVERKDMVYGMIKEGDSYVLKQVNT